jgi:hypothetical protein
MKWLILSLLIAAPISIAPAVGGLWLHDGSHPTQTVLYGRVGQWVDARPSESVMSPSVQWAQRESPSPSPGKLEWQTIRNGFEAGEIAVIVDGGEVDRIFLARIAPAKFRFEVLHEASGERNLDAWMTRLGAALVINGSYYAPSQTPDTPILSAGTRLGPETYDARAGAFVASAAFVGIKDLAQQSWQDVFKDARDAMVSYPLLMAEDGASRVVVSERFANRSFVGQDRDGNIILGTTARGFFSLYRLAAFLPQAPFGLKLALNLDGGPLACQGISLDGFGRRVCETTALPIVLAVFPK